MGVLKPLHRLIFRYSNVERNSFGFKVLLVRGDKKKILETIAQVIKNFEHWFGDGYKATFVSREEVDEESLNNGEPVWIT